MPRLDAADLQEILPYRFRDTQLLRQALVHRSYANEVQTGNIKNNERLEFLGDAVLESVTSDYLYRTCPDEKEGDLSKRRVALVCEENLDRCARKFSLEEYLYLGKGEEMTGGRQRASVVSDAMEALIGAVYLDGGYEAASEFIRVLILKNSTDETSYRDPKSELQEYLQAKGHRDLKYVETGETGPDHDKTFYVTVRIEGNDIATASGRSKKAAEKKAAKYALEILRGNDGNTECI